MAEPPESAVSLTVSRRAVRRTLVAIGLVIVLVAIAVSIAAVVRSASGSDTLGSQVISSGYQAVFLSNSEVYFGKLDVPSGSFVYLRHVYRLTSAPSSKGQPSHLQLVKLTHDVHSPQDELVINRNDILYVENLNPAGKAAQLLNQGGP